MPFAPSESDPRAKGQPTTGVKQAGHEEPEK
jgi:hypothetical protein